MEALEASKAAKVPVKSELPDDFLEPDEEPEEENQEEDAEEEDQGDALDEAPASPDASELHNVPKPPPSVRSVPPPPTVEQHAEREAKYQLECEAVFASGKINRPPLPGSQPKKTIALKPRQPSRPPPASVHAPPTAEEMAAFSEARSSASTSKSTRSVRVKGKGASKGGKIKSGKGSNQKDKRDTRRT